jgi:hypothetical protein
MADSPPVSQGKTPGIDAKTSMNLDMRRIINDAYAFVRGNDFNKYVSHLTYEELLSLAIDRIDGSQSGSAVRAPRIARIAQIKSSIATAVNSVMSKPTSAWVIQGDGGDVQPEDAVNTPEDASQ